MATATKFVFGVVNSAYTEEERSFGTIPAGTVQTVLRPHLTREEIEAMRKE